LKLQAKILCVLQNYLAPGNFSNLAGVEQLIRRTPPLAASVRLICIQITFIAFGLFWRLHNGTLAINPKSPLKSCDY